MKMNESIPIGDIQGLGKIVQFGDSLVYWHNPNSTLLALGVYNLTTRSNNEEVWTWNGGQMLGADFLIVNSTLYFAFAGQGNYPVYNGSIIYSSDLKNWKTLLTSNTMTIESLCEYNGQLIYGGYRSDGAGTYSIIDTSQNGREVRLFTGTPSRSDDVTFLAHFNSTMVVGGDAFPQNMIYTNSGLNWTDGYTGTDLEPPYVMGWSFNYEDRNGVIWMADSTYSTGLNERSGLASFDGSSYHSFPMPYSLFSIAHGAVGGTMGTWNSSLTNFPGHGIVFLYNTDGSLGKPIMSSNSDGSVMALEYSPNIGIFYGLYYEISDHSVYLIQGGSA